MILDWKSAAASAGAKVKQTNENQVKTFPIPSVWDLKKEMIVLPVGNGQTMAVFFCLPSEIQNYSYFILFKPLRFEQIFGDTGIVFIKNNLALRIGEIRFF